MGSENVICINLGTGTLDDARYWVEYCNSAKGSYYADLRVKYGHEEPYHVKYWCLGNEVDGEPWIMGYKNAEDYCKIAKEAAKVMRYTDRDISFIANGSSYYDDQGKWVDWNWKIINEFRDIADYISIHRYWEYSEDYDAYMGKQAMILEEKISIPAAQARAVQKIYGMAEPMYLSFDEWAPHPHGGGLLTTLAVAQFLNAFIRHADMVKMANYTLLTSILGFDPTNGKHFKTPFFYVFKMFSNGCLGKALDPFVRCDTFDVDSVYRDIPYLDVSAVYAEDDRVLIINVVNRHKEEAIETDIVSCSGDFASKARVQEVYSEDPQEPYTYARKDAYVPQTKTIPTDKSKMTYTFPPHSFTQIAVEMSA